MYIDIHTHKLGEQTAGHLCLYNFYADFDRVAGGGPCSAGVHPWYLDTWENDLTSLQSLARLDNVLAIGECGLDKVGKSDWELQTNVFRQQIQIANACAKPLIIHCVKAFDEVVDILVHAPARVPVIFHGYRNKAEQAKKLVHKGYYLSFGAALLRDNSQAAVVFRDIQDDRYFLETDDGEHVIDEIYEKAAELKNISKEDIILQIEQNFKTVFKR